MTTFAFRLASMIGLSIAPLVGQEVGSKSPAVGQKLTYSGSLEPAGPGGGAESMRRFRAVFVVTEATASGGWRLAWVVEETAGKPRWPWSQRFGTVPLSQSLEPTSDREAPAIQGQLDGIVRALPITLPYFAAADKLKPGAEWDEGDRHFEVAQREDSGGRRTWVVASATTRGGRAVDWVDEQQPIVARHQELVFLGQGGAHELRLELERVESLAADDLAVHAKGHAAIATLRGNVKDKLSESSDATPAATPAFLDQARTALGSLSEDRKAGPYAELAADLLRETQTAIDQQRAVAKLREQMIGKPAPNFTISTTRGEKFSPAESKGKPIVLHFWEYRSELKIAPYGETGYLDFLSRQREKDGVRVVGIAVDDRLRPTASGGADPQAAAAARKDIRSFCEFMNLSYSVGFDEQNLIAKYGDPRAAGGKLPLYVVVAPDGTVSEYHVGLWGSSPDEGLKDLDQRLRGLPR